jgi:hypothetical protein
MKRICLSAAFILAFLSPLSATTVQRLSFDDLVAKAQSIVVGQVIDSRTDWNDGHKLILTSYTIQAQESMKNASPTVTVTTVGGKILHVSGMPVLEPGENVILFLEQSNSYTTVVGLKRKSARSQAVRLIPDGLRRNRSFAKGAVSALFGFSRRNLIHTIWKRLTAAVVSIRSTHEKESQAYDSAERTLSQTRNVVGGN